MLGLFEGLFGEGLLGTAAELALDMCLLDEMAEEDSLFDFDNEDDDY